MIRKTPRFLRPMPGPGLRAVALAAVAGWCFFSAVTRSCAGDEPDQEPSARQLYNFGTSNLTAGKLAEAESYLQSAVASQNERVQPTALYNLGLTRFQQGTNELTNAPNPRALDAQSAYAGQNGTAAIHGADDALAGNDLQAIVAAYLRGRGARHDLKGAIAAVQRAIDTYGVVLAKWRRASGDFHSTIELRPTDRDAQTNADLTDRYIAELLDRLKLLMRQQAALRQMRDELGQKMAMLKGKMPGQTGPPLMGDDSDDDDDDKTPPKEPRAGDQESAEKNGAEMELTPEEAQRLLGLLQLDVGRKLYLGGTEETDKPRDHQGRDW
jgi:tetratricopeptide (TPR) repeat protein